MCKKNYFTTKLESRVSCDDTPKVSLLRKEKLAASDTKLYCKLVSLTTGSCHQAWLSKLFSLPDKTPSSSLTEC